MSIKEQHPAVGRKVNSLVPHRAEEAGCRLLLMETLASGSSCSVHGSPLLVYETGEGNTLRRTSPVCGGRRLLRDRAVSGGCGISGRCHYEWFRTDGYWMNWLIDGSGGGKTNVSDKLQFQSISVSLDSCRKKEREGLEEYTGHI